MKRLHSGAAAGLVLFAVAVPAAGAQQSAAVAARIVDFAYQPGELTVALGTTVTWTNGGARPHTVTDRGGTFDTNPVLPGRTASVTLTAPGVYHIFCRINPSRMNGVIVVRPGPEPAAVNRIEAIDPALPGESLRFSEPTLALRSGSTVLFANVGGKPHTLTADNGEFDTGVLPPGPEGGRFAGANATVTLSKPGTYAFHCEIHPAVMKGTITVTGETRAGPSPPSSAATTARVTTVDFAFGDAQASVAPGGRVTWHNAGAAPHTATFDDVALDTGTIKPGADGTLTAPDKPGSYSYRCTIHPAKMRGVVVVVGQNAPDPTKAVLAKPAATFGGSGPRRGVTALALVTAVAGSFFGGFGISAFLTHRRARAGRRAPAEPPQRAEPPEPPGPPGPPAVATP
jgi:plastocyanin